MKFDLMQFSKYMTWFHDGDVISINHDVRLKKIVVALSSAQIIGWEEFDNKIPLSKEMRIVGKLFVEGIETMQVNGVPYQEKLQPISEFGEVLRFRMNEDNSLKLSILWKSRDPSFEECTSIQIRAKSIWWENIPDLEDKGPLQGKGGYLNAEGNPTRKGNDESHLYPPE